MHPSANKDTSSSDFVNTPNVENYFPYPQPVAQNSVAHYNAFSENTQPKPQLLQSLTKTENSVDGVRPLWSEPNRRELPQPSNSTQLKGNWPDRNSPSYHEIIYERRTILEPVGPIHNLHTISNNLFQSAVSCDPWLVNPSIQMETNPSAPLSRLGFKRPGRENEPKDKMNGVKEHKSEVNHPAPPPRTTSLWYYRSGRENECGDEMEDVEEQKNEKISLMTLSRTTGPKFKRLSFENEQKYQREAVEEEEKRRCRTNITKESTCLLNGWLNAHLSKPFPNKDEKTMLSNMTGLSTTQVSTWFANARRRMKKENQKNSNHGAQWPPENSGLIGDPSGNPMDNIQPRYQQWTKNWDQGGSVGK